MQASKCYRSRFALRLRLALTGRARRQSALRSKELVVLASDNVIRCAPSRIWSRERGVGRASIWQPLADALLHGSGLRSNHADRKWVWTKTLVQTKTLVALTPDQCPAFAIILCRHASYGGAPTWTLVLRAGEVQQVASFNGLSWQQPAGRYLNLNEASIATDSPYLRPGFLRCRPIRGAVPGMAVTSAPTLPARQASARKPSTPHHLIDCTALDVRTNADSRTCHGPG
jgi:hypothetical protein